MTTYAVLLPGDERVWEAATPEEQAAVIAQHEEFSRVLAERGHRITGGVELTHSRTARQVRSDGASGIVVTDGPYAESVEQLGGLYLVESDDLDDLLQACGILASTATPVVEVRAAVDHGTDGGEA